MARTPVLNASLIRSLLGLGLGLGWYLFLAPTLVSDIDNASVSRAFSLDIPRLRQDLGRLPPAAQVPPLLQAKVDPLLRQAEQAWAEEDRWGLRVAGVLDSTQRQRASALEPALELHIPRQSTLADVRMIALAQALQARYGYQAAGLPPMPLDDPWQGYDPQRRVRALIALLQADGLRPEQAGPLLSATLNAIQAQERRIAREQDLRDILPEATLNALKPKSSG